MESWSRFRIAPGDAVTDAEPLEPPGPGGPAPPLAALLASEGLLRVELVLGRLRDHEAEFLRVDARSGLGLDVAMFAAAGATFLLVRPVQAHSSGLSRLAFVYSVLARSRDAVVYTDASPAILGASARWLELYGVPLAEVLGRNPRIVNSRQAPRSFFRTIWGDLTDPQLGSWSGELVNRRASGELIRVWQTITTFRDAQEAVAGYLGVTRDLNPYCEVVARLERSNRELARLNRLQDDLLRGIAPDLCAPSDLPPSAERLNLRSLARAERELAADRAHRCGVRIRWREEGLSLPSVGDKNHLSQAIAATLSAAVEAAPPGGEVELVSSQLADGSQEILVATEGADAPKVAVRLPFDWSPFPDRLWAAVVFDPAEKLWATVAESLANAGIPAFVAQREEELYRLCRQELPNLLVLPAEIPLPESCRSFSPALGAHALVPAVCRLRHGSKSGQLVRVSIDANPGLTREIEALFVCAGVIDERPIAGEV